MPTILLHPGEHVTVQLEGSDGEFEIHFDSPHHPGCLVVKETAGLPGSGVAGDEEVLYYDLFHSEDHRVPGSKTTCFYRPKEK